MVEFTKAEITVWMYKENLTDIEEKSKKRWCDHYRGARLPHKHYEAICGAPEKLKSSAKKSRTATKKGPGAAKVAAAREDNKALRERHRESGGAQRGAEKPLNVLTIEVVIWYIEGVAYSSKYQAAKKLKIAVGTVENRCKGRVVAGKEYPPKDGWYWVRKMVDVSVTEKDLEDAG